MKRQVSGTKQAVLIVAGLALALGATWFVLTSALPDGLEHAAESLGFAHRAGASVRAPMAGYEAPWFHSPAARKAAGGVLGVALCFLAALLIGRLSAKRPAPSGRPPADATAPAQRKSAIASGSTRSLE